MVKYAHRMKEAEVKKVVGFALLLVAATVSAGDALVDGWRTPPRESRPHTWWHWMNGNVSKAGITADLEAMASAGLGGVQLFDAGLPLPAGPVRFASAAWYDHIAFAAHEAERLGLSFGLANCSGWTSSGGPWITPELSMKFVTNTSVRVKGGERVRLRLSTPADENGFYEDIAVVAFPTPRPANIDDFDRRVFRLRGDERGPIPLAPLADDAFSPDQCVRRESVVELTSKMAADGTLDWDAPAGDWTVLRVGYMSNGRMNHPATPGGAGLECDKLDARAMRVHFDAYIGKCIAAIGSCAAFDNVLIDSYEVKGQNWTRGLEREFKKRKGYDILPWLPVFAGRPVGSARETDRFLADFRRVVADLFAENYGGEMARLCHAHGLAFACEPYGNSPSDDLQYGEKCDIPMCEFWIRRGDGRAMDTRWGHRMRGNGRFVASIAHFWGKPVVGAEAFTAYPTQTSGRWLDHPASIKAQGDRILADGVNRFYFHRYVHQPWTAPTRYPGMTMAYYGGHFERTQTWWDTAFRAYLAYLARVQFMLRRGTAVVDVLFDVGDEAPNFGTAGEVPRGWRADHATSAAVSRLRRDGGAFVSPGGMRYRLVLKQSDDAASALAAAGIAPDFLCDAPDVAWTHRRDGGDEMYFVANSLDVPRTVRCSFRDAAAHAELWRPEGGGIFAAEAVAGEDGRAALSLELGPAESVFVVFRSRATQGAVAAPRRGAVVAEHDVAGPWQVSFRAPGESSDACRATFAALMNWSAHPDAEIRYFSGTATYRATFSLPAGAAREGRRCELDLGDVRDVAEVAVNGRRYPVLWKAPFRVDVTGAVKPGENALEVRVTNRWPNRLIGDERLYGADTEWNADNKWGIPLAKAVPDWVARGEASPTGRRAFAMSKLWRADDALLPSGLLGPVQCIVRENTK